VNERAAKEDAASAALILDRLDYLDDNYDNDVSYLVNEGEDATVAARCHAALLEEVNERAAKEDAASTALILDRLDYLDDSYDNDVSYLVNEGEDATGAARCHAALLEEVHVRAAREDVASAALILDRVDYLLGVAYGPREAGFC
jgi:hypothetical protein